MDGRRRIAAAIAGQRTGTVPVMLHNFPMAVREAGFTQRQYREDPAVIAAVHRRAVETYGYDGIVVDIDTVTLAGAVGVPVDFPEDDPARAHLGCLPTLDAVADLNPVDLSSDPRVAVWLEAVRLLRAQLGDAVSIRGNCDQCPFSLAGMMRTPAAWLMDLTDPDQQLRAEALLDYCTEVACQFVRLMAAAGADLLSGGDSPAGPDVIAPRWYRRFAQPYERRVVAEAHAQGCPYLLHICGRTDGILADMLDTGADVLELDHKTDLGLIRRHLSGHCALAGNIDPVGILRFGTPALVYQATRRLVEAFRDEPRFILNAGCAIPADTPPANLNAMIAAARE